MLNILRQNIIQQLWNDYQTHSPQAAELTPLLKQDQATTLVLDHFAVIDLPGPHTGIPVLKNLFTALGYIERGHDYLPDKQNDFLWLCEEDALTKPANLVLPQVVVADFRIAELPANIRNIVEKYAGLAQALPEETLNDLLAKLKSGDASSLRPLTNLVCNYLAGRDWPLPTVAEFNAIQQVNELLAWVLVFGRRPNHFTFSIHLLNQFKNLAHFNEFLEKSTSLTINREGGAIKGSPVDGIMQSSTQGHWTTVALADGDVAVRSEFMEFVWRYPAKAETQAHFFSDYFTGFIATYANHVIESLYTHQEQAHEAI